MSPYAPRIISLMIHPDKIRTVIGPGGKPSKDHYRTGVKIDINDTGLIYIAAPNMESASKPALEKSNMLIKEVEVGEIYTGKVNQNHELRCIYRNSTWQRRFISYIFPRCQATELKRLKMS